jgi:5-formyltetrahydrofolate cyclo-ligase
VRKVTYADHHVEKKTLRNQLRERLEALAPDDIRRRSEAACERLIELPEYRRADALMLFLSTPHEIDTTPLAVRAWDDGKRVLAPAVFWEQRRMLPVEIRSLSSDVRAGPSGIREPAGDRTAAIGEIDLVVVPGLAFDQAGNRLGRGRGFYDRFLAHRDFRATICALAFEEQLVERLPAEPHDMRIHILVTDAAVRRFEA